MASSGFDERVATDAPCVHTSTMTLKSAATFAFIGTLLATLALIWDFVSDIVYVTQGLVPLAKLLASFVGALAALSVTVFFYIFQKTQN